jgi:hypothetical protein
MSKWRLPKFNMAKLWGTVLLKYIDDCRNFESVIKETRIYLEVINEIFFYECNNLKILKKNCWTWYRWLLEFDKVAYDKDCRISCDYLNSENACIQLSVHTFQSRNLVIINVSPLEYGHILIVPDSEAFFPQILTQFAIKTGLECMLLSSHR